MPELNGDSQYWKGLIDRLIGGFDKAIEKIDEFNHKVIHCFENIMDKCQNLTVNQKDLRDEVLALKEELKTKPCLKLEAEKKLEETHYVIAKSIANPMAIAIFVLFIGLFLLSFGCR